MWSSGKARPVLVERREAAPIHVEAGSVPRRETERGTAALNQMAFF